MAKACHIVMLLFCVFLLSTTCQKHDSSREGMVNSQPCLSSNLTIHNSSETHKESALCVLTKKKSNRSTSEPSTPLLADPCESPTKFSNVVFACFLIFVVVVGICGNLLAVFVILSSRTLQKQVAFKFIISLAVADIGVSMFVTSIKINSYMNNGSFCLSLPMCYFTTFLDYIFPMASITHLLIIAVDRFYAITMPFKYTNVFTHFNAKVIIVLAWIYVIIWVGLGMFPWSEDSTRLNIVYKGEGRYCFNSNIYYVTTLATVIYFIPIVVATCLYGVVLWVAIKQSLSINKMKPSGERNILNNRRGRRLKRDLRAARTISVVFAAYTICWLPHFITVMIGYWNHEAIRDFSSNYKVAYDIVTTTFNNVLPTINSCINPFIYFLFGANFRVAFKDVLYKLLNKPRDGVLFADDYNSTIRGPDHRNHTNGQMDSIVEFSSNENGNGSVRL